MTKKVVTDQYVEISGYTLDGFSLEELKDTVQGWIDAFGEKAIFSCEIYDNCVEFIIAVKREETDEEYTTRMQKEKARKSSQESKEREEYERLKAKYGN